MRLPVIVSMGGVNAAGRTSGHQAYRRMVLDSLSGDLATETITSLAVMMGLVSSNEAGDYLVPGDESRDALTASQVAARFKDAVLEGTLVRRIEPERFDVDALYWQSSAALSPLSDGREDTIRVLADKSAIPDPVPEAWTVEPHDDERVQVTIQGDLNVFVTSLFGTTPAS